MDEDVLNREDVLNQELVENVLVEIKPPEDVGLVLVLVHENNLMQ